MADVRRGSIWPLPNFCFMVDISDIGESLRFHEVSGLDAESSVIEYRAGNDKRYSRITVPGNLNYGAVTLKGGVLQKDSRLFDWFPDYRLKSIKTHTVTIKLLDCDGKPSITWTLINAWPTKITGTNIMSDRNEMAVESLVLAHEGLTIERME